MPPEVYKKVTYDVEAMKRTWAEVIGFKSPDVVGKMYPEIKPGKYTYKDKEKLPFDKMMWKHLYDRFNPPPKWSTPYRQFHRDRDCSDETVLSFPACCRGDQEVHGYSETG